MRYYKDDIKLSRTLFWEILSRITSDYKESERIDYFCSRKPTELEEYPLFLDYPDHYLSSFFLDSTGLEYIDPKEVIKIDTQVVSEEYVNSVIQKLTQRMGLTLSIENPERTVTLPGFRAYFIYKLCHSIKNSLLDLSFLPVFGFNDQKAKTDTIIDRFPFLARIVSAHYNDEFARNKELNRFWILKPLLKNNKSKPASEKLVLYDSTGRAVFVDGEQEENFLFGEVIRQPLWLQDNISSVLLDRVRNFLSKELDE